MSKRSKQKLSRSTHYIPESHTRANALRLERKDRWITYHLGGVLAEQTEPDKFQRVLDVGSGVGSWVIDTALAYPTMSLVGIEIDPYLVNYARAEAETAQVSERVAFHCMDALQPLDFPDASFDLVNMRLGGTFIRTWEWPKVLREFARVTKPQGTLRLTNLELTSQSNSAATTQINQMLARAFFHAGHFFEPTPNGLTAHLDRLLSEQGYRHIQTKTTTLVTQAGSAFRQEIHQYFLHALPALQSFICKWAGVDPKEYKQLCQQALFDGPRDDYYSETNILTIWATIES